MEDKRTINETSRQIQLASNDDAHLKEDLSCC